MLVTFQYRGLLPLDMYCTLTIEVLLKSNIHFDWRYLKLWNACIISLVFIVLNVRDWTESNYPSIVFLSIYSLIQSTHLGKSTNANLIHVNFKQCL